MRSSLKLVLQGRLQIKVVNLQDLNKTCFLTFTGVIKGNKKLFTKIQVVLKIIRSSSWSNQSGFQTIFFSRLNKTCLLTFVGLVKRSSKKHSKKFSLSPNKIFKVFFKSKYLISRIWTKTCFLQTKVLTLHELNKTCLITLACLVNHFLFLHY